MNKKEHLDYLDYLKKLSKSGELFCVPAKEGAFYFGHYISLSDYIKKYEKVCKEKGWI